MHIKSRLPDVGTTIFTRMSRMAQEFGAINLSQGFPDFPIDETLIRLVNKYMQEGHNQYAPMAGVPALRSIIAEITSTTYNRSVDPENEVTIMAGGTEALYAAIAAFIHPGDEVILFDPSYDSYSPSVRLNGGVPVHINLLPPSFSIPWNEVKCKISERTKMIMINTPHNPTGSVLTEHDMQELEKLVLQHEILVLSDEVYDRIIFDELTHQSILRSPAMAAYSIAVFSFGKTFHTTGWKVGYTIAAEHLTREIRKTHQYITFSVNTPVQMALAEYLKHSQHYQGLGQFYQKKRDLFLALIKDSAFTPLTTHGSYFQLVSYDAISDKPEVEMAEYLTKEYKVASIPVSVFYRDKTDNKLLRFCFAKKDETLNQAAAILRSIR